MSVWSPEPPPVMIATFLVSDVILNLPKFGDETQPFTQIARR